MIYKKYATMFKRADAKDYAYDDFTIIVRNSKSANEIIEKTKRLIEEVQGGNFENINENVYEPEGYVWALQYLLDNNLAAHVFNEFRSKFSRAAIERIENLPNYPKSSNVQRELIIRDFIAKKTRKKLDEKIGSTFKDLDPEIIMKVREQFSVKSEFLVNELIEEIKQIFELEPKALDRLLKKEYPLNSYFRDK